MILGPALPPPSLYPGPTAVGRVGEETRVSCFWWAEGVAMGEGLPSSFPAGTLPSGGRARRGKVPGVGRPCWEYSRQGSGHQDFSLS